MKRASPSIGHTGVGRRGLLALSLMVLPWISQYLFAAAVPDYQIKAVYLYNFSNFISWPDEAFGLSDTPFDYCIVRRGRVEKTLASLIDGERVQGHPLRLRLVEADADGLRGCKLLYLTGLDDDQLAEYLRLSDGLPVLTVADRVGFAQHGGMVALVRDRRKIRMRINLRQAVRRGLRLNARLLQLARIIDDGSKK